MIEDARGGEHMTEDTEWYVQMAKAIQARDHARVMVHRWEAKVTDAEEAIQELIKNKDSVAE